MRLGLILPYFREKLNWDYTKKYDYWEERLHLLATMLSLFPFTKTKDLADEFMISAQEVKFWAWLYGIKKNKAHIRRCCIENGREQFIRNLWAKKKDTRNYDRRRETSNKDAT